MLWICDVCREGGKEGGRGRGRREGGEGENCPKMKHVWQFVHTPHSRQLTPLNTWIYTSIHSKSLHRCRDMVASPWQWAVVKTLHVHVRVYLHVHVCTSHRLKAVSLTLNYTLVYQAEPSYLYIDSTTKFDWYAYTVYNMHRLCVEQLYTLQTPTPMLFTASHSQAI